ncbi:MAG: hypothetical protein AAGH19_07295 [Pseudomonadota bacterium]
MRRSGLILFLALLTAPLLALLVGVRPATLENRAQLPWPAPSVEAIVSADYFARLDQVLVQRLPLRQTAVDLRRWLWIDGFGEQRVDRVVLGEDDVLFLRPTLQTWCGWTNPAQSARRANERLKQLLAEKPLLWVTVPDKFFVHGDRLPPAFEAWGRCAKARRVLFAAAMTETLEEQFIDLAPALRAQARQSQALAYYAADTHWTADSARLLPEAVFEAWLPGAWAGTPLVPTAEELALSDLALQLGLEQRHPILRWRAVREGVESLGMERTERVRRQGVRRLRHQAAPGVPMVPGVTLVVHDSFLLPVSPALAPFFEELVLVQWEDLNTARFERLLAESDRVLFQSIERMTPQRHRRGVLGPTLPRD